MKIAIGVEYDGSPFRGWQAQTNGPSVQVAVEQALSQVANHELRVTCAGRTDSGVHAWCQVAHFESDADRTPRQWMRGANTHLPDSVSVLWAKPVSDDFHARFCAFERSYRYIIVNRPVRPALGHNQLAWYRTELDVFAMNKAAKLLEGEHDFSAFRSAGCQARHAVREMYSIDVSRTGERITIDLAANGFLYHMVRNIVGTLAEIGAGEHPVDWMKELLASRDRTRAGVTAPANGLHFRGVRYPSNFGLDELSMPEPGV